LRQRGGEILRKISKRCGGAGGGGGEGDSWGGVGGRVGGGELIRKTKVSYRKKQGDRKKYGEEGEKTTNHGFDLNEKRIKNSQGATWASVVGGQKRVLTAEEKNAAGSRWQ